VIVTKCAVHDVHSRLADRHECVGGHNLVKIQRPMLASVTTTSADLIFTGELTGDFVVFDARYGNVLYRFNTSGPVTAGSRSTSNRPHGPGWHGSGSASIPGSRA